MAKQSNLKCRAGDVVKAHIHPELVFRRDLALANAREEVSVEKVLAYPVGPYQLLFSMMIDQCASSANQI